ncbi:MAG: hypothetical protein IKK85_06395 [Clostridia bacterium]|nr:hypothetical protein [Clostridia bacterium]
MKRLIKAVFCAVATVLVFFAARSAMDAYIQKNNPPEVFQAGNYTDYYYSTLNETQKQAYTAVREQVYSFPKSIKVPPLDSASLDKVLEALICDNPYMFMFNSCSLMSIGSSSYFEPDYLITKEDYTSLKTEVEAATEKIISAMPETDSYHKQLYLHDALINACTYSDTDTASEADVTGVFINSLAKCSGYAKAYKLLLDSAGIPCVLISGYAEDYDQNGTNHMWTATQTDGVWSYTDITWDDPVTDSGEEMCRRVYFCMSDDMLRRTHSQFDFGNSCPDTGLYFYKAQKSYYNDYNNDTLISIAQLIATAADSSSTQAEFMFADNEKLKKAEKELFTNEKIHTALEKADKQSTHSIVTEKVRYRVDYDINLVTIYFETKD